MDLTVQHRVYAGSNIVPSLASKDPGVEMTIASSDIVPSLALMGLCARPHNASSATQQHHVSTDLGA